MNTESLDALEINLFLEAVVQQYGHDFRAYAQASLHRRLRIWLKDNGFDNFSQAQGRILRDKTLCNKLILSLTINVTEMFRDPEVFAYMRELVLPYLATFPFAKIWLAGCASGEEAYSLAIMLHEAGLGQRSRIYATDINEQVIQQAKEGVYKLDNMRLYSRNYQKAGGKAEFADYYTARYDHVVFKPELRECIVFATHNLATDAVFSNVQLVMCRNVLIYFTVPLKERVFALFNESLDDGGFLCLGQKETLESRSIATDYQTLDRNIRLYRKRYVGKL